MEGASFPRATCSMPSRRRSATAKPRQGGEIRFAIENSLAPSRVWRGITGRERAIEVFSTLRVWDTEHNSGVLIYLLLADHDIEIIADRGIASQVDPAVWEAVAQGMEILFRQGEFQRGALQGVRQIGELLAQHFSLSGHNPDELANRPVIVPRGHP
jgi:uncharacterized membrane protein